MHVGGHILGNDISLGATLDDLGRAIFWASTANSTETGVPWGLFSQHGLLWSNGPQQVAGEEALGAWHFVSLNGQHHGLGVRLRDDSVPAGYVDAIATPDEILVREGQLLDGNRSVRSLEPRYITNDGEILARVNSDWVLLPGYTDIFTAAGAPRDQIVGLPAGFGNRRFAYLATMSDRPGRGLFVGDQLIVGLGDLIDDKTVSNLEFNSVNSIGNIVLTAEFSDGTYGYITATVIPEPWSGALALAGLLTTALMLNASRRGRVRKL
jgi:hypothetical protein